jgi:hypothetical protein
MWQPDCVATYVAPYVATWLCGNLTMWSPETYELRSFEDLEKPQDFDFTCRGSNQTVLQCKQEGCRMEEPFAVTCHTFGEATLSFAFKKGIKVRHSPWKVRQQCCECIDYWPLTPCLSLCDSGSRSGMTMWEGVLNSCCDGSFPFMQV